MLPFCPTLAKLFIQSSVRTQALAKISTLKLRLRYYGRVNSIRVAAKSVESAKYEIFPVTPVQALLTRIHNERRVACVTHRGNVR